MINIRLNWENIKAIIVIGANFCHVDKINADSQEIDIITDGYHMWHGTIPVLRVKAINKINVIYWFGILKFDHRDILLTRSNEEPNAWVKKYFTAASVSWKFFVLIISGINLNILISIAIHKKIQLELEIAIIDLRKIVDIHNIKNGEFIFI